MATRGGGSFHRRVTIFSVIRLFRSSLASLVIPPRNAFLGSTCFRESEWVAYLFRPPVPSSTDEAWACFTGF